MHFFMKQIFDWTDSGQQFAKELGLEFDNSRSFPYEFAKLNQPKNSQWYIDFYVWSEKDERLKRRKRFIPDGSVTSKKKYAQTQILKINKILSSGAYIDPLQHLRAGKRFPLVVALSEFMDEKRLTLKPQSITTYEKWTRCLVDFLLAYKYENIAIQEFTPAHANDMRRYALTEQKMSNKVFNTYKGFVSGIFNHYRKIYKLTENPVGETISNLPTKTSKHFAYSKIQIEGYKTKCAQMGFDDLWFFCRLIYYTFCRPNEEARKMRVGDIKDDHIIIYAETSKTDHRAVMIPAPLEKIFQERNIRNYPQHYYLFSKGNEPGEVLLGRTFFYDKHVKVLKSLNLYKQGYDVYGWKHTGAIELYKETKDLMLVKEQCGHSDVSQTVEYLRDLGVFHYSKEINRFPAI